MFFVTIWVYKQKIGPPERLSVIIHRPACARPYDHGMPTCNCLVRHIDFQDGGSRWCAVSGCGVCGVELMTTVQLWCSELSVSCLLWSQLRSVSFRRPV